MCAPVQVPALRNDATLRRDRARLDCFEEERRVQILSLAAECQSVRRPEDLREVLYIFLA